MLGANDREMGTKQQTPQDQTDELGQGQSGYAAGRQAEDPSLKFRNRNQVKPEGKDADPEPALGTDDRFTGRGGEDIGEATPPGPRRSQR